MVAIKALGSILPAFRLQLASQKRELGILIVTPLPVKTKSDRIEIAQSTDNLSILYEFSAERERGSVQRGCRHAKRSRERESPAFRSVELEFMESSSPSLPSCPSYENKANKAKRKENLTYQKSKAP